MRKCRIAIPCLLCAVLAAAWCLAAPAYAADAPTLEAAKQCAAIVPESDSGFARAQWHRQQVACLKDLYVTVGMTGAGPAAKAEIRAHLNTLETAYHKSRSLCTARETHDGPSGGCGTIALSPAEFRRLLKTMILAADAGWVKKDPRLADALKLND